MKKHRLAAVSRNYLSNGLAVLLCPREDLAQAYVSVYFGVGSRHETPQTNGITHILEHMLFRGTASYANSTLLNAAAEEMGGFLEGATYRDHLVFATGCHPEHLEDAIAILGELVQFPRYRSMTVEKAILREEIIEGLDASGRMVDIDNLSHRAIFGEHCLGMPIEGSLTNLERITREDLEQHRRQFLVANNAVLSIAGPMTDLPRMMRQLERAFGALPPGEAAASLVVPPPAKKPIVEHVHDAASQIDIRLAFRAVPSHDPRFPALSVLARLLTDGLASRMYAELVDRQGLAYALQAGLVTYADCGLFEFDVAVAPDRASEVVGKILEFAKSAGRFRFTPAELERVLRRYQYAIEFMHDSASDLASWYGRGALFGLEDVQRQLGEQMKAVTEAEIRAAARDIFTPQGMVVTAVGELPRREVAALKKTVLAW